MTGSALAVTLPLSRGVHAAGDGTFKVGLIGCGGRGSGAAVNAMNAGKDNQARRPWPTSSTTNCRRARARLKKIKPDQMAVDDDHCFVGFDAYQKVLDSEIDVVIIACASHFHPRYLKAAVDAGKHIFCEKPHSLDVPGIRRVEATCAAAKKKGLAIVSGLCNRYNPIVRETMKRVPRWGHWRHRHHSGNLCRRALSRSQAQARVVRN